MKLHFTASGFYRALKIISFALFFLCVLLPVRGEAEQTLADELEAAVLLRMRDGVLVRESGIAYAVDGGTFLLYAAESGKRSLFEDLLMSFRKTFVVPVEFEGERTATVGWKRRSGEFPDASGTTETALAAKAIWRGGVRWENKELLEESLSLLKGYLAHVSGEGRSWQVRNYYNYGTRAFATNSYALGYFPDFLFNVARSGLLPEAQEAAENSLRFLRNAALPNGLFASSFDPELRTLFPEDDFSFHFSPDYRIKPGDTAFIALEMLESDPEIARKTAAFLRTLWPSLPDTVYGFLSFPLGSSERQAGISAGHLAAVYRLALRLDRQFAVEIRPVLHERGRRLLSEQESEAWVWDAVNVLLALAEESSSQ